MSAELDHLKGKLEVQRQVYQACDPSELPGVRRTLADTWLSEVGLLLERLQRDVVQLDAADPPRIGMQQAWGRYLQVFSALGPISSSIRQHGPAQIGQGIKLQTGPLLAHEGKYHGRSGQAHGQSESHEPELGGRGYCRIH